MSALHLVYLPIDKRAFDVFAISSGSDDDDRGYATHLALRQRFGSASLQPFVLVTDKSENQHILAYSSDPKALANMSALPATNSALDHVFPRAPSVKAMPATWEPGTRFSFEVRFRPIIRYGKRSVARRRAAGLHSAGERDAFLAAVESTPEGDRVDRAEVYIDWLRSRITAGAEIQNVTIKSMRRIQTRRSPHGAGKTNRIEGYEVVAQGDLTITDGENFAHLLQSGVGRHTAFGFGMLLLRPPGL
jgi:CRISPR system Cascade subunit CasE